MKILFISSGNSNFFLITPFIKTQANSLIEQGITVDHYLLKGSGLIGYFKNIIPLRKKVKNNKYDILHAHYALAGWITLLTFTNKPIVVSYMGCDTYGDYDKNGKLTTIGYMLIILGKLLQPFIESIIVKSTNLARYIYFKKKSNVIPNGISLNFPKKRSKKNARNILNLDIEKKYILFLGDITNQRKNFILLKKALKLLDNDIKLLTPYPINHNLVNDYLFAADIVVLTSYNEGSPNIIKEAMACNVPIVSTNVGDVAWLVDGVDGCYLTSFDPEDVAEKLKKALDFATNVGETKGRERIIQLGLDSKTIANKIIAVYERILTKK